LADEEQIERINHIFKESVVITYPGRWVGFSLCKSALVAFVARLRMEVSNGKSDLSRVAANNKNAEGIYF
jgi:hypothetical protein